MTHEKSVSLHQQDGGMTVQAFADLHGMALESMRRYVTTGRVIGARQDARSKKWTIYPPAMLVDKEGDCMKRRSRSKRSAAVIDAADCAGLVTERDTPRAAPPSGAGAMAAASICGHAGANPAQAVIEATEPLPAKPVLASPDAALPVAERRYEHGAPASCGNVYRCPETQSVLSAIREAAARAHREGIHYLRLEGREFAQLYAALDHERSRIRKLIGKGLVDVGNLRASDSVWQKMQAMCQQGRLL